MISYAKGIERTLDWEVTTGFNNVENNWQTWPEKFLQSSKAKLGPGLGTMEPKIKLNFYVKLITELKGWLITNFLHNVNWNYKLYTILKKKILPEVATCKSNTSYISHRYVVKDFNDAITSNTDYG